MPTPPTFTDDDCIMIYSQARSADGQLVLSAGGDNYVYVGTLKATDLSQVWLKVPQPDRGPDRYGIYSVGQRKWVVRERNVNALKLIDDIPAGAEGLWALWQDDRCPGPFNAICSATDWEQKFDIPGNGGWHAGQIVFTHHWNGNENQMWLMRPWVDSIEMVQVQFNIDAGNIADDSSVSIGRQININDTSVQQTRSLQFKYVDSHSYSFTTGREVKVGLSVEFEAGLPIIGNSKVKVSVEGKWSYSETDTTTTEDDITLDTTVVIPPHTVVETECLLVQASLVVPYTATMRYHHPDGRTTDRVVTGVFAGRNGFDIATHDRELGRVQRVERRRLNRIGPPPRRHIAR